MSNLEVYKKFFGSPTLQSLEEILEISIDADEKIICVKGWLKLFKASLHSLQMEIIHHEGYTPSFKMGYRSAIEEILGE